MVLMRSIPVFVFALMMVRQAAASHGGGYAAAPAAARGGGYAAAPLPAAAGGGGADLRPVSGYRTFKYLGEEALPDEFTYLPVGGVNKLVSASVAKTSTPFPTYKDDAQYGLLFDALGASTYMSMPMDFNSETNLMHTAEKLKGLPEKEQLRHVLKKAIAQAKNGDGSTYYGIFSLSIPATTFNVNGLMWEIMQDAIETGELTFDDGDPAGHQAAFAAKNLAALFPARGSPEGKNYCGLNGNKIKIWPDNRLSAITTIGKTTAENYNEFVIDAAASGIWGLFVNPAAEGEAWAAADGSDEIANLKKLGLLFETKYGFRPRLFKGLPLTGNEVQYDPAFIAAPGILHNTVSGIYIFAGLVALIVAGGFYAWMQRGKVITHETPLLEQEL